MLFLGVKLRKLGSSLVKIFSIILVLVVIADFVLLFLGLVDAMVFWAVMIVSAIFAFAVLPRINKN